MIRAYSGTFPRPRRRPDRASDGGATVIVDSDRLYARLPCRRCHRETEHIYCLSRRPGRARLLLYACLECGKEQSDGSQIA